MLLRPRELSAALSFVLPIGAGIVRGAEQSALQKTPNLALSVGSLFFACYFIKKRTERWF